MKTVDLTKLSARKLRDEIKSREAAHYANVDAFVMCGKGHLTGSDIRTLANGSSLLSITALARQWCTDRDALTAAQDELTARERFHGSDKPIKRT